MTPDIYNLLFSGQAVAPGSQQAALADTLRRRSDVGTMFSMTGDRVLAPSGEAMLKDTDKMRQQSILQEYYRNLNDNQNLALKESMRWHDMQAKMAEQDNFWKAQIAEMKASRGRPLPKNLADPIRDGARLLESLDELEKSWNPEWQSAIPGVNALRNTIAMRAPEFASRAMREEQMWRRQFANEIEAVIRNRLYGSALTVQELRNWQRQTLDMSASPDQVADYFRQMKRAATSTLDKVMSGAAADYGPESVMQYYRGGILPQEEEVPAPGAPDAQPMYQIEE